MIDLGEGFKAESKKIDAVFLSRLGKPMPDNATLDEIQAYHSEYASRCGLDTLEFAKGAQACIDGTTATEFDNDSFVLGFHHQYDMDQQACHMGAGNEHN